MSRPGVDYFFNADVQLTTTVIGDGAVERLGGLYRKSERLVQRHRALRQPGIQRFAFEEFEDEEAVADVEQGADVRVREVRDRPRFAVEPLPELGIGGERRGQHLDRHRAIEPGVTGLVDLAHSASGDGGLNLVWAEASAGNERQWGRAGL